MARIASKAKMLEDLDSTWMELWEAWSSLPEQYRRKRGSASAWAPKDILAHLLEWGRMAANWHRAGEKGERPAIPAAGYNWGKLPELNRKIFLAHCETDAEKTVKALKANHAKIRKLVNSLTERQLLRVGEYAWTGKLPLGEFLQSCGASHYRWARKELQKIRKQSQKAKSL